MTGQQKDGVEELLARHTPLPWRIENEWLTIAADDGPYGRMHVADIRGWGHLTGRAARALSDDQAIAIQKANAALIITAVNSHASNLARIEELEGEIDELRLETETVSEEFEKEMTSLVRRLLRDTGYDLSEPWSADEAETHLREIFKSSVTAHDRTGGK